MGSKVKKPFEEVYQECYERVYNSIYIRILNRENAEDIVQDTFIKAMRAYDKYDPEISSVSTWLNRIAVNTLTDHLRKKKNTTVDIDECTELGEHDKELEALFDDSAKKAYRILVKLKGTERELLMMRYKMELSYKEMAERLGANEKAVAKRVERLLLKCRGIADADGEGD